MSETTVASTTPATKYPNLRVQILWSENDYLHSLSTEIAKANRTPAPSFTIEEFNSRLTLAACSAPELGYDKTKFVLIRSGLSTGTEEYTGRYDLRSVTQKQENPNGLCDLIDHVQAYCSYIIRNADKFSLRLMPETITEMKRWLLLILPET